MSMKELFQIVDDYTKTPNACFIIMVFMTGSAFKVFMHIIRQTIGYNKKSDGISISQFVEHTGVSATQIKKALTELKELKVITVKSQTAKSGGKSYNRYSLNMKGINTLVSKRNKGSVKSTQGHSRKTAKGTAENDQGHSRKTAKGTAENDHTKDNRQNTIEQKKREREGSIFFSFSDNLQKKYLDEYINHLIADSEYIKNETAFKIAIKKKFDKLDKNQLQDFEEWYLNEECKRLTSKYTGTDLFIGEFVEIRSIYPYFNTKGYNDSFKFYMDFEESKTNPLGFNSITELEEFIEQNER